MTDDNLMSDQTEGNFDGVLNELRILLSSLRSRGEGTRDLPVPPAEVSVEAFEENRPADRKHSETILAPPPASPLPAEPEPEPEPPEPAADPFIFSQPVPAPDKEPLIENEAPSIASEAPEAEEEPYILPLPASEPQPIALELEESLPRPAPVAEPLPAPPLEEFPSVPMIRVVEPEPQLPPVSQEAASVVADFWKVTSDGVAVAPPLAEDLPSPSSEDAVQEPAIEPSIVLPLPAEESPFASGIQIPPEPIEPEISASVEKSDAETLPQIGALASEGVPPPDEMVPPVPGIREEREAPVFEAPALDLEGTERKPEGFVQIACLFPFGDEKAGKTFVNRLREAAERLRRPLTIQPVFISSWTTDHISLSEWSRTAALSGADVVFVLAPRAQLLLFAAGAPAEGLACRLVSLEQIAMPMLYVDILADLRRRR